MASLENSSPIHLKAGFKDHQGEDNDLVKVSFTVSNIGNRAGAEVAKLYGRATESDGTPAQQRIDRI
jgi:hypothetical protein